MGLFGWKPKHKVVYRCWYKRTASPSHFFRDFKVRVHIKDAQYPGSFSMGDTFTTIHYKDGSKRRTLTTPNKSCRFKKHTESMDSTFGDGKHKALGQSGMKGKTTYYDIFIKA